MPPTKRWYLSKTLWFNAITFVLAVFSAANSVVPQSWLPALAVGITIGNMALRLVTTQAITLN